MPRRAIEYVPGVPHWFTRLHSWWAYRRRCSRYGHRVTLWTSCDRCGTRVRPSSARPVLRQRQP